MGINETIYWLSGYLLSAIYMQGDLPLSVSVVLLKCANLEIKEWFALVTE